MEHSAGGAGFWSGRAFIAPAANWTAQYSIGRLEHPEALEPGSQFRQTASVEYNRPLSRGNWATTLLWGRVHKIATDTTLNSYLLESTLNFRERNYAFSRLELVDKDELFRRRRCILFIGSGRTLLAACAI